MGLGFISYGLGEMPINLDEFLIKCPSCETDSWADVVVVCKYFHVYWLPIFPMDKEANIICKKCGLKRYGLSFDSNLINNYHEVKSKFKYPLLSYLGVSIIILFFFVIVFAIIFK